jgi:hypothetical protein
MEEEVTRAYDAEAKWMHMMFADVIIMKSQLLSIRSQAPRLWGSVYSSKSSPGNFVS